MKFISAQYFFVAASSIILIGGLTLFLNHPGLAEKILIFGFWTEAFSLTIYLWETKFNNEE